MTSGSVLREIPHLYNWNPHPKPSPPTPAREIPHSPIPAGFRRTWIRRGSRRDALHGSSSGLSHGESAKVEWWAAQPRCTHVHLRHVLPCLAVVAAARGDLRAAAQVDDARGDRGRAASFPRHAPVPQRVLGLRHLSQPHFCGAFRASGALESNGQRWWLPRPHRVGALPRWASDP